MKIWDYKKEELRPAKIGEYIIAAILNVIFLYVANNLRAWGVPFLTESFVAPLWVLNVSLTYMIAINLLFIIYDGSWFKALLSFIGNLISLAFLVSLYQIFPFDFSMYAGSWDFIACLAIGAAIFGTAIAVLVEFVKFLTSPRAN